MTLFERVYASTQDKPTDELMQDAERAYKYVLSGREVPRASDHRPIKFSDRGWRELSYSVDSVRAGDIGKAATKHIKPELVDETLAVVPKLDDVVRDSTRTYYTRNKKPQAKPWVKGYEHSEAPVVIDGEEYDCDVALEVDRAGRAQYYYHALNDDE
jgi:hypothetical protein